jgi:AraC family ethanolamine operon transcriptional activator
LSAGKLTAELCELENPRTSFLIARYNQVLRLYGRVPGDGHALAIFPGQTSGEGHINKRRLSQKSTGMWDLSGEIDALFPAGFETIVMKVPETLLHKVAETMTIPDRDLVPKDGPMREGNPEMINRLTKRTMAVFEDAGAMQASDSPVLSEDAEEDMIAEYLSCFTQSSDTQPVDRWRERYQVARKADSYLRVNLHRSVTVTELCRELQVSRRLLNYAMKDVYQIPPIQYHLCLRLQHARGLLLNPLNYFTILETALQAGFNNPGYFSIYYKRMFGESPSTTCGKRLHLN